MRGISQSNKHNSYDTYYDSRPSFIEYFHLKSNFLIYIIVVVMISHDGFHRSQKTLIVTQGNLNHQGADLQRYNYWLLQDTVWNENFIQVWLESALFILSSA